MQKLTNEIRLLKWKQIVKNLDLAIDNTIWASENTSGLRDKYPEIQKTIDDASSNIHDALLLIGKQIQKDNPDMDTKYIQSLVENHQPDEDNPEWVKIENELIDILSEKFRRADAVDMVETLDMEGLLESFDSEEEMRKLERTYQKR